MLTEELKANHYSFVQNMSSSLTQLCVIWLSQLNCIGCKRESINYLTLEINCERRPLELRILKC